MRICWAQALFIILIAVLGIGNMLVACGQKGDLYLPEPKAQATGKASAHEPVLDKPKKSATEQSISQ